MDEIPIYAVYAVEMILRQNCSWRAARIPFPAAFPPKRREFLVTADDPASEIKLRNPMIVGLAAVCSDSSHGKTPITLWRPRRTLALTCRRKRERSGRWRPLGTALG